MRDTMHKAGNWVNMVHSIRSIAVNTKYVEYDVTNVEETISFVQNSVE